MSILPTAKPWLSYASVALSLFLPGLGHAFCHRRAKSILIMAAIGGLVYLAGNLITNPVLLVTSALVLLIADLWMARDAWYCARAPGARADLYLPTVLACTCLLIYGLILKPKSRVQFYTTASNLMEPVLFAGDGFAVDRYPSNIKAGDVVLAQSEDRGIQVRRVQEVKSADAVLTTDNPAHLSTEVVPLADLRGKVLYVLYSVDPDTHSRRFLQKVP